MLQRLLNSFTIATGLGASIVDPEGNLVVIPEKSPGVCKFCNLIRSTEEGLRRCKESMAKGGRFSAQLGEPYIFLCHAGLIEWAAPIVLYEQYLGSFMCGQVLMWNLDKVARNELVSKNLDLGISSKDLIEAAQELSVISGPNVQAAAEMLFVVANYIAKTSMITLMQRREITTQQAKLAEEIHARKQMEEALRDVTARTPEPIYPLEKERELLGRVRMGDRTGAKEILNELLGSIIFNSAADTEIMKARILELLVVLSRAAVEGGANLQRLLGLNYEYVQELAKIEDLEEICIWIVKVLDTFLDIVYETRDDKRFKVVQEAMEYIKNHYKENLTLDDLADVLYISPYYLSHLFREQLGYTFVDFLTRVRVEKAKKLLAESNLSIIRIAEEVGYSDSSYFSKVFKKLENITPSKYRNQISS